MQTRNPAAALLRNALVSAPPTPLLTSVVGGALAWTPPLGGHA
jgi:hypothetical protein